MTSAGGVIVTLVGILTGVALTRRTQEQQWAKDRQIEACAAVIAEATRIQSALRRRWMDNEPVDWVAWNQVLSGLWLVGSSEVVEAAAHIDANFWRQARAVKVGSIPPGNEEAWTEARMTMEADRLAFINTARVHVVKSRERLMLPLAHRPPEIFGDLTAAADDR